MRATTNDEEDLLFMVVENNHLKALAYLLEHRDGKLPFNPNATNSKGETLLHKAACMGYLPIVAYLLSLPP
jgi:ankyrin repeat protein